MTMSIMELEELNDCNFLLEGYRINHSELTLSLVNQKIYQLGFMRISQMSAISKCQSVGRAILLLHPMRRGKK